MIHALKIAAIAVGIGAGVIGIAAVIFVVGLFRQWNKPNGYNG